MSRRAFVGGGAAALLAGCSLQHASSDSHPGGGLAGSAVDPPLRKPRTPLTDTSGRSFSLPDDTLGRLTLLTFGYSHCPDVCPVTLATIARARETIATGAGSHPIVVFVGVDTGRDTPSQLRQFLDRFDETFVGLSGSPDAIDRMLREVRLPPGEIEPKGDEYPVGHPSGILAFNPDGRCRRMYPSDTRQATWVRDLPRLGAGWWS